MASGSDDSVRLCRCLVSANGHLLAMILLTEVELQILVTVQVIHIRNHFFCFVTSVNIIINERKAIKW